jgi:hypothetical protein
MGGLHPEGMNARDQFINGATGRKDISSRLRRRPHQALGTGVLPAQTRNVRTAKQPMDQLGAGGPGALRNPCDIEIEKHRPSALLQKNVGRLDVSVRHALGMQIGQ